MSAFGRPYLMLAFYKVFWIIFTYLGSYFFVKRLIDFVESTPVEDRADKSSTEGYLYALGLFLTCIGSSVCIQQVMAECTRIGVQVKQEWQGYKWAQAPHGQIFFSCTN